MLSAIAFLPPNDVIRGFEELADHLRNVCNGDLDDLLEYFEDICIGRYQRNAPRRPPSFPIQLWNKFHRTNNRLPRTNNSTEGWHRAFQGYIPSRHPNFWKFIKVLQKKRAWSGLASSKILPDTLPNYSKKDT